jgi:LL-diaminopimelate aminotransferase
MKIYSGRRDLMIRGLREAGFEVRSPKATFYLWIKVPNGYTSADLAARFLETGVVVTPGNGFGEPGEGYFRIALTQKDDRLEEAIERIKKARF